MGAGERCERQISGMGQRGWRRGSIVAVATAAASLAAIVVLTIGPARTQLPTETVSVGGGKGDGGAMGSSGVSKDAERVIQSAVRKAVSVSTHPACAEG